jgi:lysophospholipid acyltransferase (LPLAT)-like uncharacterized protein
MRRLRKRIEAWDWPVAAAGAVIAAWLRLCDRTTRWERRGEAELAAALAEGPVIVVLWHERIALSGAHWRPGWGPISALHTDRPIGRVAGAAQARLGCRPIPMASRRGNLAASREAMRRLQGGVSIGLAGDGPSGPAHVLKDAALDWARATGRPVFAYAWAARPAWALPSWDRLRWPLPWARGCAVWRRWPVEAPRRAAPDAIERLRAALAAHIDAVTAEAEAAVQAPGSRHQRGRDAR